jgi:ATP-dependent RNA helicase RhlB
MKFTEFTLHPDLQRGIDDAGFIDCMPVQEQVLKNAFSGNDLYVQSQTGTGKTAAYLVAIFQRMLTDPQLANRKTLVMVPTRELAVQVEEEAKMVGKYLPYKVGAFYGGVGYAHQQKLLRENAQILVGTPGRVLDLNGSGQMNLMDVGFLVLDEADRMFDMGFYPDLRKLIKVVPTADRRQTMLFSATLNAWVKNLAWEYTKDPLEIEIAPENITVEEIDQLLYHVPSDDKMRMLLGIFERDKPDSAIVFCNTKRYTEIVAKRLRMNGIECEFIIGDLPQVKRQQIIDDLKAGRHKFLVATDVAARGLDIEGLSMVVNYDMPSETENYVHRIGRTARAGKTGKAYSLCSEQDVYGLPAIERYLGRKIPSEMAEPELYGEDKSAGLRIRTDDYGDTRHGDRDRGGGRGGYGERRDSGSRGGERRPHSGGSSAYGGAPAPGGEAGAARKPNPYADAQPVQQPVRPRPADHVGGEGRGRGRPAPDHAAAGRGGRAASRNDQRVTPAPRDNRAAAKPDLSRVPLEERLAYYRKKYGDEQLDSGAAPAKSKRNRGAAAAPAKSAAGPAKSAAKPAKRPAAPDGAAAKPAKPGLIGRLFGLFGKK